MLVTGRERHGQGAGRAGAPRPQPAPDGPFVAVNCGALPETSSRPSCSGTSGAPSPAPRRKRDGRFKAADGGTLFLDEVGELPRRPRPSCCACCRRAGSAAGHERRSRSTSAWSRRPTGTSRAGRSGNRFREDLFYRINVIEMSCRRCASARRHRPAGPTFPGTVRGPRAAGAPALAARRGRR